MSYGIVLLVSLAASAVGFRNYIYFFSLGYGLAIAAIGALLALFYHGSLDGARAYLCVFLMVYGLRLSGYLLIRELRSAAYRKILAPESKRSASMPLLPKVGLWISCALLYTLQTLPAYLRLRNDAPTNAALYLGLAVATIGLLLEAAADAQKSLAKRTRPYDFVSTGLYRIVRCPNYLGELIIWTGILITGFGALSGWLQWGGALLGYALIVFVMFSGARRLELRQDRNYGKDRAYVAYCRTTPILIPFVPLYSVKRYRFLKA